MKLGSYNLVYYGPAAAGKTSCLRYLQARLPGWGELILHHSEFANLLTLTYEVADQPRQRLVRFHISAIPGANLAPERRQKLAREADGIIFVADSRPSMTAENQRSLRELVEVLAAERRTLCECPLILQYNKRDLPRINTVEVLNGMLNLATWPWFESNAAQGSGVVEPFRALCARVSTRRPAHDQAVPASCWSDLLPAVQNLPAVDDPFDPQPFTLDDATGDDV